MAFERLQNSTGASKVPGDHVRVTARSAARGSRFIQMVLGEATARKASFTRESHRCHVMIGSGEDAGKVAVQVDDSKGEFLAKRRKDGTYAVSLKAGAIAGRMALEFPPFNALAQVLAVAVGSPATIIFTGSADLLGFKKAA